MKSVIKGCGYVLIHAPDMVLHSGTTQAVERRVNPEGDYLKQLPKHIRSFEQVLEYYPNQVYIGNLTPEELSKEPQPWHDKTCHIKERRGKFGEIMPQEEFILLMDGCDVFDLVRLDIDFVSKYKDRLEENQTVGSAVAPRIKAGTDGKEIQRLIKEEQAEAIYHNGKVVGCVKRAHDIDPSLTAHVMHENIVSKASSVLAMMWAVGNAGLEKTDIDYVIDCSEEACGDMNQRGGGNFAKSAAEIAGLEYATGSDCRAFCAAPAHAIIQAAALVSSGAYRAVAVTAGGSSAKLGMNGKDHVKKGLPILEDMLGGFCVIVAADDGINPEINLGMLGRHMVGTGSSPQAVMAALVTEPLERNGLGVKDVDKYAPEMQNPDITKPAGAGDVAQANYKMIAALGVKKGELQREDMEDFIQTHGLVGWAPTQGHIPSGIPYVGFAREAILEGRIKRAMIIGKGSLFLGRLTNLFDGVSFVMQANSKEKQQSADSVDANRQMAAAMRNFAEYLLREE